MYLLYECDFDLYVFCEKHVNVKYFPLQRDINMQGKTKQQSAHQTQRDKNTSITFSVTVTAQVVQISSYFVLVPAQTSAYYPL